jgi:hypothetical protein
MAGDISTADPVELGAVSGSGGDCGWRRPGNRFVPGAEDGLGEPDRCSAVRIKKHGTAFAEIVERVTGQRQRGVFEMDAKSTARSMPSPEIIS